MIDVYLSLSVIIFNRISIFEKYPKIILNNYLKNGCFQYNKMNQNNYKYKKFQLFISIINVINYYLCLFAL